MEARNTFSYTYSAKENQEVLNIRQKYLPQEQSPVEALKELDTQVRRPADVFGYVYGSVSAVVMGAGMSLVMTNVGAAIGLSGALIPGIAVGIVGMVLALTTYPIYKNMLSSRKRKFAPQILELSEKIMRG